MLLNEPDVQAVERAQHRAIAKGNSHLSENIKIMTGDAHKAAQSSAAGCLVHHRATPIPIKAKPDLIASLR